MTNLEQLAINNYPDDDKWNDPFWYNKQRAAYIAGYKACESDMLAQALDNHNLDPVDPEFYKD